MGQLSKATREYALLDGLKALADSLAADIDECDSSGDKDMKKLKPQLSRQYRETMLKISELEDDVDDDEIAAIIGRASDG